MLGQLKLDIYKISVQINALTNEVNLILTTDPDFNDGRIIFDHGCFPWIINRLHENENIDNLVKYFRSYGLNIDSSDIDVFYF